VFDFPGYKRDVNQNNLVFISPVKKVKIKGNNNNIYWQGHIKIRILIHFWWECKLVQPLLKALWRFLKKLEIELPYDPVILLLGIYPKEHRQDIVEIPIH
jgi:hypothetical protein